MISPLMVAAAVLAATASWSQGREGEPEKSWPDPIELGRQARQAAREAAAKDQASRHTGRDAEPAPGEDPDDKRWREKSERETYSLSSPKPALYVRLAKGSNGYDLKALVANMNWTEKNIGALLDYIQPWKEGVAAPSCKDAEEAHKMLASESAAAAALIVDADAAVAKGIPRDPKNPSGWGLRGVMGYLSRAGRGYANPTPAQRQMTVATDRSNVLGHLAALIEIKRLNPPDPKAEMDTERWLSAARKYLPASEPDEAAAGKAAAGESCARP